jgi:UPF0755 protein
MKRRKVSLLITLFLLAIVAGGAGGFYYWLNRETAPTPQGEKFFVRYEPAQPIDVVLKDLEKRGVVRNAQAMSYYVSLKRLPKEVREGTYELQPGMERAVLLRELQRPIRRMVRLPETNLSYRTANLLAREMVIDKPEEYLELMRRPQEFQQYVKFPLPKDSLEGYLYPDTYDLPPLYGAKNTIVRQLENFERKVMPLIDDPRDLNRILTIASMVELEAALDEERPVIAGVIENRIRRNMRLQIDATVLYALGEWRTLTYADYRSVDSPYNTYMADGLPPGPICSPSVASVKGALEPAEHNYLYYVAYPTGGAHMFAQTYDQHRANIRKRNELRAQQAREKEREAAKEPS